MAGRPSEIAELVDPVLGRDWVRANYPQCLVIDPDTGQETGELVSAYTPEVSIEYFPQLVKDEAGPVLGAEGLMIEHQVEPESTEQKERIETRREIARALISEDILPSDVDDLGAVRALLNTQIAPGVEYVLLPWHQWSGSDTQPAPVVGRSLRNIAERTPDARKKAQLLKGATVLERVLKTDITRYRIVGGEIDLEKR